MKLPNGFGTVYKLSGKRRKPYIVKKTVGWHYDKEKDKQVQDYITIGYATTRAEGLQMLADYNNNPYDLEDVVKTMNIVPPPIEITKERDGKYYRVTAMVWNHAA